eukprot:SAG31_NODE_9365_length_1289_cov_1.726891_2_plen_191_part_01
MATDKHSVHLTAAQSDILREWSLKKYELYKKQAENDVCDWDTIVITAADTAQKKAYEDQITLAQENKTLPSSEAVDWVVVADPPGAKIGPGGATMFVLSELNRKYEDNFHDKKVMIIHAGGYSQRLPSMSVCGKIFAALPVVLGEDHVPCSMLQLKLSMFCDLPTNMIPGVFVTCADDILLFEDGLNFREK